MLHSINYCMCVFLKFICIYFFLYYRGPCVRKLFTGLIMYLPSQNKEHCIVLYCIGILTMRVSPCFISSMRKRPCDWHARGHREILQVSLKFSSSFPSVLVSRLFQFFFLVLWISNGYVWWSFVRYLWVISVSRMIKRFVVVFIVKDIMCRHSPLHHNTEVFAGFTKCK